MSQQNLGKAQVPEPRGFPAFVHQERGRRGKALADTSVDGRKMKKDTLPVPASNTKPLTELAKLFLGGARCISSTVGRSSRSLHFCRVLVVCACVR